MLANQKGPEAVNREFNRIKEIKKKKRQSSMQVNIGAAPEIGAARTDEQSSNFTKQDSMTLTEMNHQLLRQIESDNRNKYNQLLGRINQFETILLDIS